MSTDNTNNDVSAKREILGLALIVLTNIVSINVGYFLNGEKPDPVEVTCELAAEIAASPECLPEAVQPADEAQIDAEEEAAENQPPSAE